MLVALTYDLRQDYLDAGYSEEETAEFDSPGTVEALSGALESLGHRVERVGNIFSLAGRLVEGERWDLVFNICEGLYGRSREAQVPALLEAYGIQYTFSDPLTMAVCLDKAYAKTVASAAGIPTPKSALLRSPEDIGRADLPGYPLFVKPVSEGTGKGISGESVVGDREALATQCRRLFEQCGGQPVLVEEFLPGREFTVGLIGTGGEARVAGVLEVILHADAEPLAYSYVNKERCEELVTYTLVTDPAIVREAGEIALASYRALECWDAGRVDLRADASGRLNFIEMNPLPGLNPSHSDLPILCTQAGMKYEELIGAIVESARERGGRERRCGPRPEGARKKA